MECLDELAAGAVFLQQVGSGPDAYAGKYGHVEAAMDNGAGLVLGAQLLQQRLIYLHLPYFLYQDRHEAKGSVNRQS